MATASIEIPRLGEPLVLWEKLLLIVGEGDSATRFKTRVEDFHPDAIAVSEPQAEKGSWRVKDGSWVTVLITRDAACYQYRSRIRKVAKSPDHRFLIDIPSQVERVQRRRSARIEHRTNVRFFDLDAEGDWMGVGDSSAWSVARTVNVSAHGMLLITQQATVEIGHRLLVESNWLAEANLRGPVLSICRRAFKEKEISFAGVELLTDGQLPDYFSSAELELLPNSVRDLTVRTRAALMNRVFQRQIEMRKKGLL